MVDLDSTTALFKKSSLGQLCKFSLRRQDPRVEVRAFLRHRSIFYLRPILDWTTASVISLFPEAPGDYVLAIEWRGPDGAAGWFEHSFEVVVDAENETTPHTAQLDSDTQVWTASAWEAKLVSGHEALIADMIDRLVKPGWVIYDIGANIGLHSIRFSRRVGQKGHVYCVEPNPLCVYFLHANLELHSLSNFTILPIAALASADVCSLLINYYNSGLGTTSESPLYTTKVGHEIRVQGESLDHLVEAYQLRDPDLIKIDIEGAEGLAIQGMEQTLARSRPTLIIEVHGRIAARQTFPPLGRLDYRFQEISTRATYERPEDILRDFPEGIVQFLALPR